jgi:hypothetical protein
VFREACTIARYFTIPVVTSIQTVAGECASGIGTAVVINKDGWIVTAGHVLKQLNDLAAAESRTRALEAEINNVKNDASLSSNDKRRKLNALPRPRPTDINRWSVWWGLPGATLESGLGLEVVDLGLGRLKDANLDHVREYPIFKDPNKNYEPGVSLCRMGFPFVDAKPVWNPGEDRFDLTENIPLPVFPNEGILPRIGIIVPLDEGGKPVEPPFPLRHIETSSAGILGQSGGPIFDQKGTIWGIQSATRSYTLDLKTKVQQYYHVGVGVHTATILAFLKENKVEYRMSDY